MTADSTMVQYLVPRAVICNAVMCLMMSFTVHSSRWPVASMHKCHTYLQKLAFSEYNSTTVKRVCTVYTVWLYAYARTWHYKFLNFSSCYHEGRMKGDVFWFGCRELKVLRPTRETRFVTWKVNGEWRWIPKLYQIVKIGLPSSSNGTNIRIDSLSWKTDHWTMRCRLRKNDTSSIEK